MCMKYYEKDNSRTLHEKIRDYGKIESEINFRAEEEAEYTAYCREHESKSVKDSFHLSRWETNLTLLIGGCGLFLVGYAIFCLLFGKIFRFLLFTVLGFVVFMQVGKI